jgi:hypothetical protein
VLRSRMRAERMGQSSLITHVWSTEGTDEEISGDEGGEGMSTDRPHNNAVRVTLPAVALFSVILVLVAIASGILGHALNQNTPSLPIPTALHPTPTPHLVLRSPDVLGAWVSPQLAWAGPSQGPPTISLTSTGAFAIEVSCIPDIGGDSEQAIHPSVSFQVFDGNGHQIDNVHQSCGGAGSQTVHTFVVPENVPAGSYQVTISDSPAQASMLILAAQLVPQLS